MSNMALRRIASAQASVSGRWAKSGKYLGRVQCIRTKDGFKGTSAIAEIEILSATQTQESEIPTKVGATIDYVENTTQQDKGGGGRFKSFLMALVGASEDELSAEDALDKFVDKRAAGVGLLIEFDVFPKHLPAKNGNTGKVISGYTWRHVELTDAQIDEIDAMRKGLKLPPMAVALDDSLDEDGKPKAKK